MTKIVGAAEFKARCLRLIDEMLADGEPITVTKRGKPVAVMSPPAVSEKRVLPLKSSFGLFKSDRYRFDVEPGDPALDPDWEAQWDAKWDRRLADESGPA